MTKDDGKNRRKEINNTKYKEFGRLLENKENTKTEKVRKERESRRGFIC